MKTLEELKQEWEAARDATFDAATAARAARYNAARDAWEAADAAWEAARDAWDDARDAYHKRLEEVESEDT